MQKTDFKSQPDDALQRLSEDELIAYICAARDAGDFPAARRGVMTLTAGLMSLIIARMRLRGLGDASEDVAMEAFEKAAVGAFRGESVGEFRAWLNTIIHGTANDWWRRFYRHKERLDPLNAADQEGSHFEPSVESESGAVELMLVTEEVLAELSGRHREVVELHVLDGVPAPEVCERLDGMSIDNVAQIASRFRKRLRQALEGGS